MKEIHQTSLSEFSYYLFLPCMRQASHIPLDQLSKYEMKAILNVLRGLVRFECPLRGEKKLLLEKENLDSVLKSIYT